MAIPYELLAELAVRSQGRDPEWVSQAEVNAEGTLPGPPSSVSDGVNVEDAIVAIIAFKLRAFPSEQVTLLTVNTVGGIGDIHTIDLTPHGGVAETYDYTIVGGETVDDVALALATDILTGVNFSGAQVVDSLDVVEVRGIVSGTSKPEPYGVEMTLTGTADTTETHEASQVRWALWGLLKGRTEWMQMRSASGQSNLAVGNTSERVNCAGLDRLYVEILSGDGTVTPIVGPGGDEQ